MGFFNEIKKVLFGAKAVTKSAADKATDYGKEKGADFLDSADDFLGSAKETAGDVGSSMKEKGSDFLGKAKDAAGDFKESFSEKASDFVDGAKDVANKTYDSLAENEMVNKAGGVAEDVGGKILDAGKKFEEKAGSVAENVGGVILDKGGDLLEKGKDLSENIGEKIHDLAGDAMEKANDLGSTIQDKTNDLVEKANAAAAKDNLENQIDEASTLGERLENHIKGKDILDQKDAPIGYDKLDESLLEGKDDFWSKAEKYAEGDYSGKGKNETPSAANDIFANTEERQKELGEAAEEPPQKEPFKGEIKGFTDIDGDGDPLIDDAIIDED
ncbi:MAG: hypothetical protein AB8H03_07310 [Saprospiraceae bacterium]